MKKTSHYLLVLAIGVAFVMLSSCQSCNNNSDQNEVVQEPVDQTTKDQEPMDKITKELVEPYLRDFAIGQFLMDLDKNEKFQVQSSERRGGITFQDLPNNEGKTASCSFCLKLVKVKNNGKIVNKGYVIMEVSGRFELDRDGQPHFIGDQFEYTDCSHLKPVNFKVKCGVRKFTEKIIPIAQEEWKQIKTLINR